ncbi:hypothetical protein JANAI62_10530 [Jannaschia pagri]|uniref:Methyltransferase FkbM domain-containing protein n=1 Tax=Jannaschia pagri TaxID=2829797 RepID=A0ABQ4NJ39_9RHOB|nr:MULTISPECIES: FkbM family methyltransferase [unclassified Jannaschia]GIT90598.1 hypothetical protein JANAI61_10560 [Jannaschia sp. AI_61]GIT94430.1 hypothetical protein JANAI62_10530 [Jannaschia sp. AI_62]
MYYTETADIRIGDATVKLPQGIEGRIGGAWNNGRFYEAGLLEDVRQVNRAGTYVDAGMNNGNHTLFFAACCPSTQVLGFEPYPIYIDRAYELFQINDAMRKIRVMSCALGAAPGTVDLHIRNRRTSSPRMRLDDLALTDTAVLKIDVEGMERQVLEGAEATIRDQKPHLYVEIFDQTFDETAAYIEAFGYKRGRKFGSTPTYSFIPI